MSEELKNGRIGVKVDGVDKIKAIRPHNLIRCVTKDGVTTVVPEVLLFQYAKEESEVHFGKDYRFTPIDLFV